MDNLDDKLKALVDKLDNLSNTLGTLLSAYSGYEFERFLSYRDNDVNTYGKEWKESVEGKILALFSDYVPFSSASADELLDKIKKEGKESTADLIILTRIESTLAFILGSLTMLVDLKNGKCDFDPETKAEYEDLD